MLVTGVSTRKVREITEELSDRGFVKATVSLLFYYLNEQVETWNELSLEAISYPFVLVDGCTLRPR
jgi:transposase-like protein